MDSTIGRATTVPIAIRTAEKSTEGKGEGYRAQFEKSAPFLFVIDDVEGIYDGLHAAIGAPKREQETRDKSRSQFEIAFFEDTANLLFDDVKRAGRQYA